MSCSKKNEYYLKQQLNTATLEKDKIQQEYLSYKTNMSTMYKSVVDQNTDFKQKIEYLRGQLKIFKDKEKTDQNKVQTPTVVNTVNNINTVNNLYIQYLEPITDELIRETGSKIGMMDLKDGAPGIMRKFQPVLKDRIICTDASRNSLMYNYNGQLKRDTRGQMITEKIIMSTEPQFNRYREEIDNYYKNLDTNNMTDHERSTHDMHYINYKEYSRAVRTKSEFSKKKISKKFVKTIVNFSKSKTQFEQTIQNTVRNIAQQPDPECIPADSQTVTHETVVQVPQEQARFNRVVAYKQTIINGRAYELHLDAQGRELHRFRLRSSGLPYLSDEDTDPESREQSASEHSDYDNSDDNFDIEQVDECKAVIWPTVD